MFANDFKLSSHNITKMFPVDAAAATTAAHTHAHHTHMHELKHSTPEETDRHELLVAKCGALAALFGATIVCGAIPFVLNHYLKFVSDKTGTRSARIVQALLYFGGGVLLCTTFLHLLPEVQEVVEALQYCNIIPELSFSLAEMLMCAGFFLMYLLEETIHKIVHRHLAANKEQTDAAAFERGHSIRKSHLVKQQYENADVQQTAAQTDGTSQLETVTSHNDGHLHKHDDYQQQPHSGLAHSHMPVSADGSTPTSPLRGLFIVLALSLHELFEGMAIGLEGSPNQVWFTFAGVAAHKLVLAFCVGVELIVARTRPCLSSIYIFTFAIVSPIGIFVGIMISHNSSDPEAPSVASAILQGLATGTLLYVVFFEILSKNHAGIGAFFAMIVGFGVMFGLQQIDHEHDHGETSCGSASTVDSTSATTTFAPTEPAKLTISN